MKGRWVLGVDIGGTNLVVAAVPATGGQPTSIRSEATQASRGPDDAVERIVVMANEVIEETLAAEGGRRSDFAGVGIGCPGPLDLGRGVIVTTPNLGWDGFPIRTRISEKLQMPASLDNDANCATFGEWWQGAGKGVGSLVGVTLGTGIGGGYIERGRLMRGVSGSAFELGHTTINFEGRLCRCGNRGCLEAYTSGPNIAARALDGLASGRTSILPDLVGGDLEQITAETVYEALVQGDGFSTDLIRETADLLGIGLANVVNLFNPQMIVLVGGVTRAGEHLFGPLRESIERRAFPSAVGACRVVSGALPATAGVIGAAGVFVIDRVA
ncbi:MAG: ROK family protein [Longimicrobiales bacterium]